MKRTAQTNIQALTAPPARILRDLDLAARTTLALPGRAALFAEIDSPVQLLALRSLAPRRFVLGGGSNLVVCGDFDGLVLHPRMLGRALLGEDAQAWYVQAGAGENWADFVDWTIAQGWPGLENLAAIPGTVGAAPIQNIGAYGQELSGCFDALDAFDMQRGEMLRLRQADCRFGYRDSLFKQQGWHLDARLVICSVTFRLPKAWQPNIAYADIAAELAQAASNAAPSAAQIAAAVTAVRRRKLPDPAQRPNAGSFFQNPVLAADAAARLCAAHPGLPCYAQPDGRVKLAAAWLIEQAAWKGRALGPVAMYEKQALVLVKEGAACGADVLALMQAVQADVRQKFGVELRPEPVFL